MKPLPTSPLLSIPSSFLLLTFLILPAPSEATPQFLPHSFFPQHQPRPQSLLPISTPPRPLPPSSFLSQTDIVVSGQQPQDLSPPNTTTTTITTTITTTTTDLIAQLSENIPLCALGCVVELTNVTKECLDGKRGMGEEDQVCLCSDDEGHYTRVLGCVRRRCTIEEGIG